MAMQEAPQRRDFLQRAQQRAPSYAATGPGPFQAAPRFVDTNAFIAHPPRHSLDNRALVQHAPPTTMALRASKQPFFDGT
jgi:hypothetical protein